MMYSFFMSTENDEELKSFQIGLRSGAAGGSVKSAPSERMEITKEDYPNLSTVTRSKATFKKKTGEKLESFKHVLRDGTPEEKEAAEKAKKAWERAMEVISQISVKE